MLRAALLLALGGALAEITVVDFVKTKSSTSTVSAPEGSIIITTSGTTQTITTSLSSVDPLCVGGPGVATDSCNIKFDAGTTCNKVPVAAFFAGTVQSTPYSTSTAYTSTGSSTTTTSFTVNTGVGEHDLVGKTIILYDYSGKAFGCGEVGAPEALAKLAAVPRVTKDNCKNIIAIASGTKVAKRAFDITKPGLYNKEAINALRSLPLLTESNCKLAYPHTDRG